MADALHPFFYFSQVCGHSTTLSVIHRELCNLWQLIFCCRCPACVHRRAALLLWRPIINFAMEDNKFASMLLRKPHRKNHPKNLKLRLKALMLDAGTQIFISSMVDYWLKHHKVQSTTDADALMSPISVPPNWGTDIPGFPFTSKNSNMRNAIGLNSEKPVVESRVSSCLHLPSYYEWLRISLLIDVNTDHEMWCFCDMSRRENQLLKYWEEMWRIGSLWNFLTTSEECYFQIRWQYLQPEATY